MTRTTRPAAEWFASHDVTDCYWAQGGDSWGNRWSPHALRDCERALHHGLVRIAHVLVRPLLQRHVPGERALARDRRRLVQAGAGEVEVVDRGRVLDDD